MYDELTQQRFWSKVDKRGSDECWPWLAGLKNRYGRFAISHKNRPAHRVAWEIANSRAMPAEMLACHSCDNPPCCNPAHIWPGTSLQNTQDCIQKGRAYSVRARSAAHCRRGHELSGKNLRWDGRKQRRCNECQLITKRKRRAQARANGGTPE